MGYIPKVRTVFETPTFTRQADRLFHEEARRKVIAYLAGHPFAGTEIPGTGGVRKLRFGARGRGKRGGARVIYYATGGDLPVYALLAYAKSARDDLSPRERRSVARLAADIRRATQEGKP